jgi:glucokinase
MAPSRAIGIDVGGTKILAGLVEADGTIVRTERRETPVTSTEDFLRGLAEVVDSLRDETVATVGIGIPSTIDQRDGTSVFSVHVPIAGVPLRSRAEEHLGLPVAVDNDANAAAMAEWSIGAGRGCEHMIMLTLGTGIGGGLILGGRLYRGWTGAAAELGHMVLEFDGPPCRGFCTGHGHFEQSVSGSAAADLARELLGPDAGAHELVSAARSGDDAARDALGEMGRRVGAGIASLVNIFNPELVVVGGGFGVALDLLIEPALETLHRDGLPPARDLVRVVAATLGEEAGMVGAALIAFDALDG